MNEVPYNLLYSTIALVIGGFLGLSYSYKKYQMPYVEKVRDKYAMICSIIGSLLFLVELPYHINYPIACLLMGVPFGMRPGYGNIELYIGVIIALVGYSIKRFVY
jgi:energy-converting hydrogenase A subunit L